MPIFKKLWETVKGDTKVGSILHQVLPLKKTREAIGAALLGLKKASPLPEFKDPEVRREVESVVGKINSQNLQGMQSDQLLTLIYEIRDILDDGKQNDSVDRLDPKIKALIIKGFSALPLVAYLIYAITTGDWNIGDFLDYVGAFIGL